MDSSGKVGAEDADVVEGVGDVLEIDGVSSDHAPGLVPGEALGDVVLPGWEIAGVGQ
jgi:hypothetical protein